MLLSLYSSLLILDCLAKPNLPLQVLNNSLLIVIAYTNCISLLS
nr:MAG TPA: hypothetical protein [Crassvirales sp.]